MGNLIPTFQTINELHQASTTSLATIYPDVHVYRHEQAMISCRPEMPAHRANFYQIGYDQAADYALLSNGQPRKAQARQLWFAGPGHVLSWSGGTGIWAGTSVMFTPQLIDSAVGNTSFLQTFPFFHPDRYVTLPISLPTDEWAPELLARMLYEYEAHQAHTTDVLRHQLMTLLYLTRRLYEVHVPPASPPIRNRALEIATAYESLVETHFLTFTTIQQYADHLCLTPKYLTKAVKVVWGKTAHQVVQNRLLREAQTLLRQTNRPLFEIARNLGYTNPAQFSRFFRQATGQNPLAYRQKSTF